MNLFTSQTDSQHESKGGKDWRPHEEGDKCLDLVEVVSRHARLDQLMS